MGIYSSIVVGTAKKSAGEATFYQRLGTKCFRKKPIKRGNSKATVAQLQVQFMYRFLKNTIDSSFIKPWIDAVCDGKRKSGKGQTKMNMFYQTVMPALMEQRQTLYENAESYADGSISTLISSVATGGVFTKGILGPVEFGKVTSSGIPISGNQLQQLLNAANEKIGAKEEPFTASNVFVYALLLPSTGDDLDSFAGVSAGLESVEATNTIAFTNLGSPVSGYGIVVIAIGREKSGGLDITQRYFCSDGMYIKIGS